MLLLVYAPGTLMIQIMKRGDTTRYIYIIASQLDEASPCIRESYDVACTSICGHCHVSDGGGDIGSIQSQSSSDPSLGLARNHEPVTSSHSQRLFLRTEADAQDAKVPGRIRNIIRDVLCD
jgi:hypothetical protein